MTRPEAILFIGNSYTAANDLPGTVARLARTAGRPLAVDSLAGGGLALYQHLAAPETNRRLHTRAWTHVVLQEQSILPALAGERERWMYPAVRGLAAVARSVGAEPVLCLTWARLDVLREFGFTGPEHLQCELAQGCEEIAREVGLVVAQVGPAWQIAHQRDSAIRLWQEDGSHPAPAGSYLAACVLYATLFNRSPVGLPGSPGVPGPQARFLQEIASECQP